MQYRMAIASSPMIQSQQYMKDKALLPLHWRILVGPFSKGETSHPKIVLNILTNTFIENRATELYREETLPISNLNIVINTKR